MGLNCPHCGKEIDRDLTQLDSAKTRYPVVTKVDENRTHLVVRVKAGNKERHFAYRKDDEGMTDRWSFRVRSSDAIINGERMDRKDGVLYTSTGKRFGELDPDPPDDVLTSLMRKNLK